MNLNAKAILSALSAVGIAAAVASPAMARPRHVIVPDGAYGYYGYSIPGAGYSGPAQSVYGADRPVPPHAHNRSVNPDFQLEQGN